MSTTTHPSNRLYRGECTSPLDAIETYRAALEYEAQQMTKPFMGEPANAEDRRMANEFREYGKRAGKAIEIYQRHVRSAELSAIKEMRESGDDILSGIADALESGDYSTLAI